MNLEILRALCFSQENTWLCTQFSAREETRASGPHYHWMPWTEPTSQQLQAVAGLDESWAPMGFVKELHNHNQPDHHLLMSNPNPYNVGISEFRLIAPDGSFTRLNELGVSSLDSVFKVAACPASTFDVWVQLLQENPA